MVRMIEAKQLHGPGRGGERGERGAALIVAILAALLLTVLGAGVALTGATDVRLAANDRDIHEAFYAADAAAGRALSELRRQPDWTAVLSGTVTSTFVDGPPGGAREIASGTTIVLDEIVNEANCAQAGGCSDAAMNAVTPERPWGSNNPRWRLFAWGRASDPVGLHGGDRSYYVVVLVADDQSETDGDPTRDGEPDSGNPGAGIIGLRALGFGAGGLSQTLELTIARSAARSRASDDDGSAIEAGVPSETSGFVRLLSWRWIR
ncbi:MAG TPA: PilX N-terminal domain-containing pilus assembly protein [Vicinamibacterales bacterium]|nr:PilX N-terminal domain-containing pilus assembly protein [Vicinamibacterales bacterium]